MAWWSDSGAMDTDFLNTLATTLLETVDDVLPIAVFIFAVQYLVLGQAVPNVRQILIGFLYVLLGLTLFLEGLGMALFPVGKLLAQQLTDPTFVHDSVQAVSAELAFWDYRWVYLFAAAIGFSTTVAEPALIAVSIKAGEVSGGTIDPWGLRIAVAIGVSAGIALGTFRIISGTPLHYYIIAGYVFVVIQTLFAPKAIIALAYDSGGVTTSTVTVPLVTALGLGLASNVPGRSPLLDGFGLIAFASLFPMITVMAYAQLAEWRSRRRLADENAGKED